MNFTDHSILCFEKTNAVPYLWIQLPTKAGKIVFLKFFAPTCPHCKSMSDAWNKLATHYEESPDDHNVLIGSIDCTDSPNGKALCARFKVVGLPTLLYGDASFGGVYLEEYAGEKSFEDLKSFALKNLASNCTPGNLGACSPDDRSKMELFMTMPRKNLKAMIEGIEANLDKVEQHFGLSFDSMQKQHDLGLAIKENAIIQSKENVKLIKEVMAMKQEQ